MDWNVRDALFDKLKSKPGYKNKVAAKCLDCIYDPEQPGTWRGQVDACQIVTCALHDVRPRSSKSAISDTNSDDDLGEA